MKGNSYKVIRKEACGEFVERRSRFISFITPVIDEANAVDIIAKKKKEFYNATHNVYAYRLLDGVKRFSDDGEPQGTAGIWVLDVLDQREIENALIVVTRYFGGTKLGAGGLVRAYSNGAKIALNASEIVVLKECEYFELILNYNLYGSITNAFSNLGAIEISADFSDIVKLQVKIEKCKSPKLISVIKELSSDTIKTTKIKTDFSEI